jgi:asparagine synthetase B (glutamine-hydrolysing)
MTDVLPVANLILRGDEPFAPDASSAFSELRGHFALHLPGGDDEHVLARDPLGVNKLFYAVAPSGRLDVANFFIDLRRLDHPPSRIWSVPSGHLVRISPARRSLTLEKYSKLAFAPDSEQPPTEADLEDHAARIRTRLEQTFRALRPLLAGRPLYVTMSGGLDSTTVAALTRELVGEFIGLTFRVEGPSGARDDHFFAQKVAQALGVRLEVVTVPSKGLIDLIDPVLLHGQDYRDFNVHCGLVNAALAAALRDRHPGGRPVVLTGDTMNELVADYTPVAYGAREYYGLPRVGIDRMRRFLVTGLDSGDREVGIFAHQGVDTIQPYALCPEVYCALPGSLLAQPAAKQRIARLVMGDRVPSFIYDRPKVRAQVGSSEEVGGTLAALVDQGIDAAELERRFCRLQGFEPRELKTWIRGGYYRFTSTYPEES